MTLRRKMSSKVNNVINQEIKITSRRERGKDRVERKSKDR